MKVDDLSGIKVYLGNLLGLHPSILMINRVNTSDTDVRVVAAGI